MTNITINTRENRIELTATFAKKASRFGTHEYADLQAARRDYPNYRVVTVSKTGASDIFKGLTYDAMRSYIERHDNGKLAEIDALVSDKDNKYGAVRSWFFEQYPALSECKTRTEFVLALAA